MQGGGFIPKQSSFLTDKVCLLKATGFLNLSFLVARFDEVDDAIEESPGCHGDGMELPTSLPASEAEKIKKV